MIERKHIIEKSAQLFRSSGIRTNTMDDIACAVGISKKTLYQHVADKNELITEVIASEFVVIKSSIDHILLSSANSIEALLRFNAFIVRFLNTINPVAITDLHKLYQAIHNEWKDKFQKLFSDAIKNSIVNGKKSGIFRDDINEELITQLHTEKIDQFHETDGYKNSYAERVEVIKEMATYYIRGLVTKQGETILNKHLTDFNKYLKE
ncbi:MAG: TetR/AcrR family transcriptional regulator [Salinivirgaceae bacterium]|jgi:AcrR family transcriptional regulator|nr:TetR/AcrR family transcriptional regulator [Salinivirgaceae bacterium]